MYSNKKVLLTVAFMLFILAAATIINVAVNFRSYAYDSAGDKAKMTASIVRDGLTAHMVNNIMDKRLDFLRNVASAHSVNALWLVRAPLVEQQFGDGFSNEHPRDEIDKEVLHSAKTVKTLSETSEKATLRVTIPYIASAYGTPNCLDCHTNAKEGDVLGAISMSFDVSEVRSVGAMTVLKIFGINLIFLVVALYVMNRYTKPFMSLFSQLNEGITKAQHGNFHVRIEGKLPKEGRIIAEDFNALFNKLEETFGKVKQSLATFITKVDCNESDPLHQANAIIHELADVYRFKKTIELDKEKHHIYNRLIHLFEHKFDIRHYALYEINHIQKHRKLIAISHGKSFCSDLSIHNAHECRAFRTGTDTFSTDFPQLCEQCENQKIHYICVPFQINDQSSLVLSISTYDTHEYVRLSDQVATIKNYFEAAKPVIESKILLEILKDTSVKDGLTGLYNRRFLDEFVDKISSQAARTEVIYAVLMVDIDYFKMVNDTHGHDVGDMVIKRLAEILGQSIRESDLAIRFGGEEFMILLHEATEEGAMRVAEKIRTQFGTATFQVDGANFSKTASIGVSLFPTDADSIWKVIKFSDTALYKAKNSGRNKVVRFQQSDHTGENY